jgi:hypothetical protein
MLLLAPMASASTVTDLPPFLRGDVEIGYAYDRVAGDILERGDDEVVVAQRAIQQHVMHYGGAFAVAPGAALTLELPHYISETIGYDQWSEMVYDPSTDSGTYQGTQAGTAGTLVKGSGVGGVWIGAKGTPFSQLWKSRNHRATWLLGLAVRTPDGSSLWSVEEPAENGPATRGAGPGGVGVRLETAFSATYGASEPYMRFAYTSEGSSKVDVLDDTGTVLASGVEVDPGDTAQVRFGTELVAGHNEANGQRTAVDLHLGMLYTGYGSVPSGVLLPSVLSASAGQAVQTAEQFEMGAGLGLNWRPMDYLELRFHGDLAWQLPSRPESPYPEWTGDQTLHYNTGVDLAVRVR